jgi:hypothetical protein
VKNRIKDATPTEARSSTQSSPADVFGVLLLLLL